MMACHLNYDELWVWSLFKIDENRIWISKEDF